jgi:cell division protein FtsB
VRAYPRDRAPVTGRALLLGVLVVLLVVVLAAPANRYFGSRNDRQTAAEQLRSDQQELAKLRTQLAQWSDPGYIQRQARDRLQYAMPGDVVYVVVRPGQQSQITTTSGDSRADKSSPTWNQRLWQSVEAAGKKR